MLVKTLDAYDLKNVMTRCGRNNFSFEGYSELIYYFDEWCKGFVEELNCYTWAILLDNGNVIYRDF